MKNGGWPLDLRASGNNSDMIVYPPGKNKYIIPADALICNYYTIPHEFLNWHRFLKEKAMADKEDKYMWIE